MSGLGCPLNIKVWMLSGRWVCNWGFRRKVWGLSCKDGYQNLATQLLYLWAPAPNMHPGVTSPRALACALWRLLPGMLCLDFYSADSYSSLKTCSKVTSCL